MRHYLARSILAVMILLALFAALKLVWASTIPAPVSLEQSVVKVMLKRGHGSGVSIGNGFILSAAHVVDDAKTVTLKTMDGKTRPADVLWTNTEYDIALLKTDGAGLASAPLDCRRAKAGTAIVSYGNPVNIEFASAYGRIAGEPRKHGPWRSVYVTDTTTVMGMSGGPVFSTDGRLIGITVGVMGAPMGFSVSLVGYGFVVPSQAACGLLARA